MDVIDKSWKAQKDIEDRVKKVGKGKYGRVFRMARKPTSEEYIRVIQITGLGLLLIGGVGFLIYFIMNILPGYLG